MKRSVVLGLCIIVTLIALFTPLSGQLVYFVVAGKLPFTNITLSPLAMLLFWSAAVPISITVYRIGGEGFWRIIEMLGHISQRHINRHIRWTTTNSTLPLLIVSVMLHIATHLPESSAVLPELSLRRRFLALPSP